MILVRANAGTILMRSYYPSSAFNEIINIVFIVTLVFIIAVGHNKKIFFFFLNYYILIHIGLIQYKHDTDT